MSPEDDARMKAVEARCAKLENTVRRMLAGAALAAGVPSSTPAPAAVASDEDLDGRYGDPKIVKDPPRWRGERMVGKTFSETSAEYLDEAAKFFDWLSEQREKGNDDEKKKARFSRADAARARGWAQRFRKGHKAPPPKKDPFSHDGGQDHDQGRDPFANDDEIPF